MIFFANPKSEYLFLKKKIDNRIAKVLNSNSYILGNEVRNFENNFAKYLGVKYAVGVSNGTDALILALRSINIKKGDEIITTSHTAFATISSIIEAGAIPVFIDINEDEFTIDTSKIQKRITKKTKAIIAVHIYGNPVEITTVKKIAKKNKLTLIEDCSQAHGAEYKDKKIGTFGDISCFSFYPTKNLSTYGDGGIVTTNNYKTFKNVKLSREYGWVKKNFSIRNGSNKRLDEIHAGILDVKLKYLDKFNQKRILIAQNFTRLIKSNKIILPKTNPFKKHVYHLFVIRIKNNQRNKFLSYLKKNNISAGIHYPTPNHRQKPFKKFAKNKLPVTEKISKEIVSLPNFPLLNLKTVKKISSVINKF